MYEIGDKMSERNIYKLFKELDDCEKRCLKKLIENEEKEPSDEQIRELAKWLEKDHYSADSVPEVIDVLNHRYKDTTVELIFVESAILQKQYDDRTILVKVQCKGNDMELYDLPSLLKQEIKQRRFLTDKKTVEQLIASTKEAYEEYYGDE